MAAGAPYGNKNAEKWTFKKSVKMFHHAIELTKQKITYHMKVNDRAVEVTGYEFDFIGEIARELGTFKEIFTHLAKRFPALQRLHNELNNNIESNCYHNTKKGIIKEATGIVNLKSNWKWTDRTENRHEVSTENIPPLKWFDNDRDTQEV